MIIRDLNLPRSSTLDPEACMYPEHNQLDPDNPDCREESTLQTQTQSTDGRNSSPDVCTLI